MFEKIFNYTVTIGTTEFKVAVFLLGVFFAIMAILGFHIFQKASEEDNKENE